MSIIFIDSLSRYGSADNSDAAPFTSRYGLDYIGSTNSAIRHRTSQSMFGQPFLAMGTTNGGDNVNYLRLNLANPQTKIGVSFKFGFLGNQGSYSNLNLPIFSFVNNLSNRIDVNIQVLGLGAYAFNTIGLSYNTSNPDSTLSTNIASFANSLTNSISGTGNIASRTITSLTWMTVDLFANLENLNYTLVATNPTQGLTVSSTNLTNLNQITSLRFGTPFNSAQSALCYSDVVVYIDDGIGLTSIPNAPRSRRVQRIIPSANGSENNWIPSTGSNFSTINESPYNDLNYSAGIAAGSKQTFLFNSLGSTANSVKADIKGVVVNPSIFDTGVNPSTVVAFQKINDVETVIGNDISANRTTYNNNAQILTLNPETNAQYSASQINSMELGFEIE